MSRINRDETRLLLHLCAIASVVFSQAAQATEHLEASQDAQVAIDILYLPPSCLADRNGNINLVRVLFDHFERSPGSVVLTAHGLGILYDGHRYLFSESGLGDGTTVRTFLTDTAQFSREVLEASLPVLVSPFEINFQYPTKGHFDWLQVLEGETQELQDFPDTTRVSGQLARYTNSQGVRVLALELPGDAPINANPLAYTPEFGGIATIETPDDKATLYLFGKQIARGSRVVAEVKSQRQRQSQTQTLILHPGDAISRGHTQEIAAFCAKALADVGVAAVVPREQDLGLGVDELVALAEKYQLPYVAANVLDARTSKRRPFRRFLTYEINGLTVVVIGITGSEQLKRLPASVKAQWVVEDPSLTLSQLMKDIEKQLGKRPDLTIALVGAKGDDYAKVVASDDIDIVVADQSRYDLVATKETLEVSPRSSRERSRGPGPLTTLRSSPYAVGHVQVQFEPPRAGRRAHLTRIVHETEPITEEGPKDSAFEASWRPLEDKELLTYSQILLPDVAPIIARHQELVPLVWGNRILYRRGFRRYERHYPARYSDPLWMRFVCNLLKDVTGADVALSRNLPRTSDIIGPISRGLVLDWLQGADSLRVAEVSGEQLIAIARRLLQQQTPGSVQPENYLFSVGIEPERLLVAGHPINAKAHYRLTTTDFVMAMSELRDVFEPTPAIELFTTTQAGQFVGADDGHDVLVKDVVLATLDTWTDASGNLKSENAPLVEAKLLDDPEKVSDLWMLALDEFSLRGAQYANSKHIDDYAATRQTRATTPDNFSLGNRTNAALIFEGPAIGWETRLKTTLDRIVLHIPGAEIPPQEQSDDVLGSTELRLNAVRLNIGDEGIRLVPFVQTAFDTEFTATPDPAGGPDATFPHQKIWRSSLGLVMYPGQRFKELRLGGVFQRDFSESKPHNDFGVSGAYRIAYPLIGPLTVKSDLDLLYFIPDGDDRVTDLAVYATWANKLVAPFSENIAIFLMADVVLLAGKTHAQPDPAASWILGGGIEFSGLLKI